MWDYGATLLHVGTMVNVPLCTAFTCFRTFRAIPTSLLFCRKIVYFIISCIMMFTQAVHFLDSPVDAWEIPRDGIEIGEKVGQGNYATVFRGQLSVNAMSPKIYAHKQEMEFERRTHLTVAVKMLQCK